MTTQVMARTNLPTTGRAGGPVSVSLYVPSQTTDAQLLDIWLHDRPAHTQRAYRHDARCFMASASAG
jgi:hypothetical protein